MSITKFVTWDIPPLSAFQDTRQNVLHQKLERGEKLNRDEKDYLFRRFRECSCEHSVKQGGWLWNFERWVNRYWVKIIYGPGNYQIEEWDAFDKTSIRSYCNEWLGSYKIEIVQVWNDD